MIRRIRILLIVLFILSLGLAASAKPPLFTAIYWVKGEVVAPALLPLDFKGLEGRKVVFYHGDWPQDNYIIGIVGTEGLSGQAGRYIINILGDGNLIIDSSEPYNIAVANDPEDNYGADPVLVSITGNGFETVDLVLAEGAGPVLPEIAGPLTIKRLDDNVGADIEVSWDATEFPTPQIYILDADDKSDIFINTPGQWTKVAENGEIINGLNPSLGNFEYSEGKLTHKGEVRSGKAQIYYKLISQGAQISKLKDAPAVGKFNINLTKTETLNSSTLFTNMDC